MPKGCPNAPLIDRFLRRVEKTDTCWLWKGGKYSNGYGQLVERIWGDGYTHRWSFKYYHKQEIPDGYDIRHKCDNRICVNPNHLELGTRKQNVADMIERFPGKPCNRKFEKEQIEEIKALRQSGLMYKEIAERFNCNRRTIEKICLNKTYKS